MSPINLQISNPIPARTQQNQGIEITETCFFLAKEKLERLRLEGENLKESLRPWEKVTETYQREELKKRVFMEGVWKEPSDRENMNESKRLEDTQINIVYRVLGRLTTQNLWALCVYGLYRPSDLSQSSTHLLDKILVDTEKLSCGTQIRSYDIIVYV